MTDVARLPRTAALLLLVTVLCGCLTGGSGDGLDVNGRPLDESGGDAPALSPDLASIQANVFTPRCAISGCHTGGSAPQGLSLAAGSSFANLVGVVSNEVPSLLRVAPGDPDASYLIRKLQGEAAVGGRMPLIGPPLPQSTVDVIREWISNGAMDSDAAPITAATVIAVAPEDNATLSAFPAEITVTFSQDMNRLTLNVDTVVLDRSGGDGSFAEGNETSVGIAVEVSPNSRQAIIRLTDASAADDAYRLTLLGTAASPILDALGNSLDGDADGTPGGDFVSLFSVASLLPTLSSLQERIFTPLCSVCHVDGGIAGFTGLWLDESNSAVTLINVPSVQVPALLRVGPGDPSGSYLVQKLEGTAAVGERMPLGGPVLPESSMAVIRQWISAGAPP